MIHDFLMWAGGILITGLVTLTGWRMNQIDGRFEKQQKNIDDLEASFNQHRLHSAENFITKVEIATLEGKLIRQLDRIEEKLDKKVDK